MMLSRDGTSIIGKIGILLPLLIVFIAADAAACPEHRSGAALRTKAVKIRNGGSMQTTVISYRAPATYRLCGNTLRDTRGIAYVRDGRSSYINDGRYVAARYGNSRVKYVAVRNVDRSPRYVAIRRSSPVYIEDTGVRYVAVRSADRYYDRDHTRTIVRGIDIGPDPRYASVRRAPIYVDNGDRKYVSVRDTERYSRVAVRDVDIDDGSRYVIDRDADRYDDASTYVAVRARSGEYPAEIEQIQLRDLPIERSHAVQYSDVAYSDDDDAVFISTDGVEDACSYPAGARAVIQPRMVSYVDDEDIDDYAFLRVRAAAPAVASYRPVSYYAPADEVIEVDEDDGEYATTVGSMAEVSYIPAGREVGLIHDGAAYLDAEHIDQPCIQRVATCRDTIHAAEIGYVPADRTNFRTVSYVPAEAVETVSYVPLSNLVEAVDPEIETLDCPLEVSYVDKEAFYVSNSLPKVIGTSSASLDADYYATSRIARDYGLRDGFEDGEDAGMERDAYHPENSGDYQKATNGYEDSFGDKDIYRESYRAAYLNGYRVGFDSIARSRAVG